MKPSELSSQDLAIALERAAATDGPEAELLAAAAERVAHLAKDNVRLVGAVADASAIPASLPPVTAPVIEGPSLEEPAAEPASKSAFRGKFSL